VTTAAVALINGWGDPLDLLALDPEDFSVAVAVVREAERMRAEQDAAKAEASARLIARELLPGLAKHSSALVRAVARMLARS
jgi:hypothetical protein